MTLGEMTMPEFKKALKKTKTIIIPFGSVEAHGAHLPLNTDTLIMREVAKKAAAMAGVFMSPLFQYGVCTSTGDHPGTITIRADTVRMVASDIVRDCHKKGLRNFILISGHGGGLHMSAMKEAGETLTQELSPIKIAVCCIYELVNNESSSIIETPNDSHAGEGETSLVLHLAPGLVKGSSKEEYPKFQRPVIARDKLKHWPGAVWGDPSKATAEKGSRLFNLMVKKTVALVRLLEKGA
ncbi:MAG: creatininase family protein [Deltaproteobacteria bacterium]|nr:creatininase family protein [Deltaproteobacteria bacterium]